MHSLTQKSNQISYTNYAPAQIEVPAGKSTKIIANEYMTCQKRGRPIGSKDKNTQKRKGANNQIGISEEKNKKIDITDHKTLKEVQVPKNSKNKEILVSYVSTKKRWNRNEIIIDNIFFI